MLKKFPCLADSSSCTLTDEILGSGRRSTSRGECPANKVQIVQNSLKQQPDRSLSNENQDISRCPPSEISGLSQTGNRCTTPRQLWARFKTWFRGLCICGRKKQSCQPKLRAWRSFRKDCLGRIPITMETPDVDHINYLYKNRSRTPQPDPQDSTPPPPYSLQNENYSYGHFNDDCLSSRLYTEASHFCSLETGGTRQEFQGRETPWCKILYWEGNERKGNVYQVLDPAINVLGDTPHGSGLSLAAFFGGAPRDERIRKTRRKICQGLVLWREGKVVWVYNRSEAPVYLNSASLDGSFFNLNLYKCPPGYAMIIYYYEMANALMGRPDYANRCLDKADVNSVRISFAKGWGKNYQRREILCCPCWIEVHVVPTLRVEQLTPPR